MLPEDLVEEVLLRLPPASPASLVRAGLVCKRWCHVISDPVFQRRFREFHRSPPMLGFLYNGCDSDGGTVMARAPFVPASPSCPPHASHRGMQPRDSRHGCVLLHTSIWFGCVSLHRVSIIVWDPISEEQLELPKSPPLSTERWTVAVLCAATPSGACDHLHCHRGPFTVVLVGTKDGMVLSYVYSSESGAWSQPTSPVHHDVCVSYWKRSALVGNFLYFVCENYKRIIEYGLVTQKISVIELPDCLCKNETCPTIVELTTTEAGRLGFTRVEDFRLCLWSREVEDARWTLIKVIDLDKLQPLGGPWTWIRRPRLVGSVEGVGVIFLIVDGELYTVDLRSDQVTKVDVAPCHGVNMIIPYLNFYTPVLRASTTDDGPRDDGAS